MSTRDPHRMRPGQYVTDGTRLLRIVTALERRAQGGLIELEDCRSLELILIRIEDLGQLRRVQPSKEPVAVACST
jgi:hypothetical protein